MQVGQCDNDETFYSKLIKQRIICQQAFPSLSDQRRRPAVKRFFLKERALKYERITDYSSFFPALVSLLVLYLVQAASFFLFLIILSIDPFGISRAFLPEFLQLLHICLGFLCLQTRENPSGLLKADVDKTGLR